MEMNNLIGVSGGIKCGKDLVGEMLQYLGDENETPTFEGFESYLERGIYYKYEIKKCADKLKDCICVILGCTREQLEDRDYKETELGEQWWYLSDSEFHTKIPYLGNEILADSMKVYKLTPRLLLQLLGTQGGRMVVHPDIWVNALFSDYKPTGSYCCHDIGNDIRLFGSCSCGQGDFSFPNWVITDVRFPQNEGKAITNRDGLLIGIKRYFKLRFPEYAELAKDEDPYAIPEALSIANHDLFKSLTHESETSMGNHSWCDVIIKNNGTIEELFDNLVYYLKIKYEKKEIL